MSEKIIWPKHPLWLFRKHCLLNGSKISPAIANRIHWVRIDPDGRFRVSRGMVYFSDEKVRDSKWPMEFSEVAGGFTMVVQTIRNTDGIPDMVGGSLTIHGLARFTKLPDRVGGNILLNYVHDRPMLKLLTVETQGMLLMRSPAGLEKQADSASMILNQYLGKGRDGIIPCAAELHKAGLGQLARL